MREKPGVTEESATPEDKAKKKAEREARRKAREEAKANDPKDSE